MPNYTFLNTETNEYYELYMSVAEREQYVKDNPAMQQVIHSAPALGDSIRLGLRKPDDGFRDRLREIKKAHSKGFSKSTVNTF